MVTVLRTTVLSLAAIGSLTTAGSSRADDYCAAQPPPQGLVERCRSRVFIVPDNPMAFRFQLTEWMRTCVSSDRAPGLVYGAESVDTLWDLIKGLPNHSRVVTVIPKYEPLTFTKAGKTCYGVKSVEFDVRPRGTVDPGNPTLKYGPPDDLIKSAAKAAKAALMDPSVRGSAELSRFLGVLDYLERHGEAFDDTYYAVGPALTTPGTDAVACYRDASTRDCLPAADAVKQCTAHLAHDLVSAYHGKAKMSPKGFADFLEGRAREIQRGFDSLRRQQESGTTAMVCPGVKNAIMPLVVAKAKQKGLMTLYGHY
jgi:hypothetical protein